MPGFGNGKVFKFYRTVSGEHRSRHCLIHVNVAGFVFQLRRRHLAFDVAEIFPRLVRVRQERISRAFAPKGLEDSAGFNPVQPKRVALTRKLVELRVTLTSVNQRVSPAPTGPNVF